MSTSRTIWEEIRDLLRADVTLTGIIGVAANIRFPSTPKTFDYKNGAVQILVHPVESTSEMFEAKEIDMKIAFFGQDSSKIESARGRVETLLNGYAPTTPGIISMSSLNGTGISYNPGRDKNSCSIDYRMIGGY